MSLKSELLQDHSEVFENRNVVATGFFPDTEIISFGNEATHLAIWCTDFVQFRDFSERLGNKGDENYLSTGSTEIFFGSSPLKDQSSVFSGKADTGIIYLSKNRKENLYYLTELSKILPKDAEIYAVGANDEGVKGMETSFKKLCPSEKYAYGRKCAILRSVLKNDLSDEQNQEYEIEIANQKLKVDKTSGVFSMDRLDVGTEILLKKLATLDLEGVKRILDVGTGSGVIATFIKKLLPNAEVSACDVSALALKSAERTATLNGVTINLFPSDMLSNADKYDLIISNPPFHVGKKQVFFPTLKFIMTAKDHLLSNGNFLIVANAFIPYEDALRENFSSSEIIYQDTRYKIHKGFKK